MRRQDISVLVFYYLGYSKLRNLVFRIKGLPIARFVLFHDIPEKAKNRFRNHLTFLKIKTNVVSIDDFFEGRLSTKKINTVITFDDGFKSWVTFAIPLLKELNLPATFFISSGFVGLPIEEEKNFIKMNLFLKQKPHFDISGSLTVDDVKKIAKEGFTIGSHTLSHCNLMKIDNIDLLKKELVEDKDRLEMISKKKIRYFSYPFGYYKNSLFDLEELLKKIGYRGAVTTISGPNTVISNPYTLHREITYASMLKNVFRARVYGNYDAVKSIKRIIHNIC
ncbi:MAG: polysaccharide deacetylase family protein [Thermodesulfobacteriota bacterium]